MVKKYCGFQSHPGFQKYAHQYLYPPLSSPNIHLYSAIHLYPPLSILIDLYPSLSIYLNLSIYISLSIRLYLSLYLRLSLSLSRSIHLSVNLSIHRSMNQFNPSIHPSIHRCIYLSISPSIYLCITIHLPLHPFHPSISLPVYFSNLTQPNQLVGRISIVFTRRSWSPEFPTGDPWPRSRHSPCCSWPLHSAARLSPGQFPFRATDLLDGLSRGGSGGAGCPTVSRWINRVSSFRLGDRS